MSKNKILLLAALATVILGGLSLPLSNYFLQRKLMVPAEHTSEDFKKVSFMMQEKCADCHTPGAVAKPIYYNFPGAHQLIEHDMEEAQEHLTISHEHLKGTRKFTGHQMSEIQAVIDSGEMPLFKYKIMHWDASITQDEREALYSWMREENFGDGSHHKKAPSHSTQESSQNEGRPVEEELQETGHGR